MSEARATTTTTSEHAPTRASRNVAMDALRGFVIVLMALDHTRDFYGDFTVDALDVAHTTVPLFATRWVTHLCAPGFVFLAGASAYLHAQARGPDATRRFLLTRGAWLILLEVTVIRFAWSWNPDLRRSALNVFWALGGAMIALAPFVRAPRALVAAIGAVIVAGHNLADPVTPETLGPLAWATRRWWWLSYL